MKKAVVVILITALVVTLVVLGMGMDSGLLTAPESSDGTATPSARLKLSAPPIDGWAIMPQNKVIPGYLAGLHNNSADAEIFIAVIPSDEIPSIAEKFTEMYTLGSGDATGTIDESTVSSDGTRGSFEVSLKAQGVQKKGCLILSRLPTNPDYTVILVGYWDPDSHETMMRDMNRFIASFQVTEVAE